MIRIINLELEAIQLALIHLIPPGLK